MTQTEIFAQLQDVGAIIRDGHFVYTSGKHGSAYINKDAIYPHTGLTSELCKALAERFQSAKIDVVAAPVVGGVILSQWMAHHLSALTGREVLGLYAEKEGNAFVLKRGYDQQARGKRVLVVEDILNTGGSARKVVEALRELGAEVVGVAALCNRGKVASRDLGGVHLESLVWIQLDAWEPSACPLCQKGVPINTQIGKGSKARP